MALTEEGSSEGDFVVVVGGFDFAVHGVLDFVDDLRLPPKMFHHERTEIRGNPHNALFDNLWLSSDQDTRPIPTYTHSL